MTTTVSNALSQSMQFSSRAIRARCSFTRPRVHSRFVPAGNDVNEGVELAGPAGVSVDGMSIYLYNGNNGVQYDTIDLTGSFSNMQAGFGVLHFPKTGLQNGAPDGLALVDSVGAVVEFLSYEGTFVAADGPAAGLTSTDIGQRESGGTAAGESLQRVGFGDGASDFTWTGPLAASFGSINVDQTFSGSLVRPPPPPPLVAPPPAQASAQAAVFINELHYDNDGE